MPSAFSDWTGVKPKEREQEEQEEQEILCELLAILQQPVLIPHFH